MVGAQAGSGAGPLQPAGAGGGPQPPLLLDRRAVGSSVDERALDQPVLVDLR
jgi:hypothetical protein